MFLTMFCKCSDCAKSRPPFRLRPCSCSDCRWMVSFKFAKIMYSTQCDVLLGANWLAACQPQFLHGGILCPSEAVLGHLPIGHSWVPIPVSQDSCLRACLFFLVCLSPLQITNQSTISSFSFFVPSKAARAGSSHLTHDDASTSDQCLKL
jgi:hypothetical protein